MVALVIAGCGEEAMAAADGLIDAAEATRNPFVLSFALLAYGLPSATPIPSARSRPCAGALVIAQDSGNRFIETQFGDTCCPTRGRTRRPAGRARLHRRWRSATTTTRATRHAPQPAGYPRRRSRPARTLRSRRPPSPVSRVNPLSAAATFPEINTAITHLRDVLGDQTYESLARKGETMTTAAMVTYAYDQIDQARAELNAVSK